MSCQKLHRSGGGSSMRRMQKPTCAGSQTTLPGSRRRSSKAVAVVPTPQGPLIHSSIALAGSGPRPLAAL
jgi:hypothetical protein